MAKRVHINADQLMIGLALGCVVLPVILFLFGWTRLPITLAGTAVLVYLAVCVLRDMDPYPAVSITQHRSFWVIAFVILAVWVLFSGVGGWTYQNDDWEIRNATFNDLCNYDWPVFYDKKAGGVRYSLSIICPGGSRWRPWSRRPGARSPLGRHCCFSGPCAMFFWRFTC